jgi:ceramide glucosyltransferase
MIFAAHPWMIGCGTALAAAAACYTFASWVAVLRMRRKAAAPSLPDRPPPVSILKPLCGAEPELYECLRSFCDQAYPSFQIVFGVRDRDDPAVAVVSRLRAEFPAADLAVAIDRRQHGNSRKVSNLINMMALARHDYLVVADSDIRVERDYLAKVVGPLRDAKVGIVTCLYRGNPRSGLWSLLGSMFIDEWFMPSVCVAAMAGSRSFAFGATIAIRRQVLARIGGFEAIANQLADDFRMGELTRRLGLQTVLSEVVVETCVDERTLSDLLRHELRWLRTIRAVRPAGYGFSFITFGLPVAALGTLLAGGARPAVMLFGATVLARVMLLSAVRSQNSVLWRLLILPLRDGLGLALWAWGFVGRSVHWRNDRYQVICDGSVHPILKDLAQ